MIIKLSKPYEQSYIIDENEFKMPYKLYGNIDYEKSKQQYIEYNWRTRGNFYRGTTSKILLLELDI